MSDTSSHAWYIAIERYVATLPPEHKHAFNAPASAEDCLLLIGKHAQATRPSLKRFEGSIDTLVQTQSLFLSPIWGPLRCVLGLVNDRLASLASVTTLLERLVDPLKRFQNYERLFENNTSLRIAIGSLYCDLIEFCSRVVIHCTKSILRKNFGNFDRDVQEISLKITHHWNEVDVAANAANLAEAKAARLAEERERTLQRQIEINRWLAPANVEDDLSRLSASCHQGSCDWILQTPEFLDLENASGFHALHITGHPGGGKSTAASFLIDRLLASDDTVQRAVLYFFCKASDTDKTFASTIMRTLIFQLLKAYPALLPTVQQAFCKSGQSVLSSETEAFALFEILISQASSISIYIILDAVDECRDAPTLLRALLEVPRNAGLPLKVAILGREDPDLKTSLQSCDGMLALNSHRAPLEHYIEDRVSKLTIIAYVDDTLRKTLISNLIETSNGLWLFATMLLDEIERAPSPEEITRQLQNIPHGMVELYTSILRSREAKFSPTQLRMVQQIYLWLDKSEYTPVRLWKRTSGDSLEDEMICSLFKYACASSHIFNPIKLVQGLCTPLVHTRVLHPGFMIHHNDGHDDDAAIYVAELFHQTAKQYLHWSIDARPSQVPDSLKLRRLGHLHRGVCALWYFSESSEFKQDLQQLREQPREAEFECTMSFSCALWRALDIKATTPAQLAGHEREAEKLCEELVWFISTDRCLDFIEVAFIVNFTTQSDSTMATILSLLTHSPMQRSGDPPAYSRETTPSALRKLEAAQALLIGDLAWIIASLQLSGTSAKMSEMPVGFKERPLAIKMLAIARKWQWLSWAPRAVSNNGFLISPKR